MRNRILAVIGAGVLAAGVAVAQPSGPSSGEGRAGRLQRELGLSEAQLDTLQQIRVEARKAGMRRRADLGIARLELEELMGAPSVDEKAIAAKVRQVSDLHAASLQSHVETRLAMRKVLTAEQFARFKQLRRERPRGERGGRHRGHRGDHGMGSGDRPEPGDDHGGDGGDDESL